MKRQDRFTRFMLKLIKYTNYSKGKKNRKVKLVVGNVKKTLKYVGKNCCWQKRLSVVTNSTTAFAAGGGQIQESLCPKAKLLKSLHLIASSRDVDEWRCLKTQAQVEEDCGPLTSSHLLSMKEETILSYQREMSKLQTHW